MAAAPLTVAELSAAVVDKAGQLLARLDDITTQEFSAGGERAQREALRAALNDLKSAQTPAAGVAP